MMDLGAIEGFTLDASLKAYPHRAPPCAVREIGARGWNVMRGDLPFPVAVLRETALAHNLEWMARFTRSTGVLLAPHGKTTMAPQLFARQLDAGAWGITLATMQPASLAIALGLRRVIVAIQLVGREDIARARELVATVPGLELYVLVDSLAGVALLEALGAPRQADPPFNVLLEMGRPGGRTGCRSADDAMGVARAVAAGKGVQEVRAVDHHPLDAGERVPRALGREAAGPLVERREGVPTGPRRGAATALVTPGTTTPVPPPLVAAPLGSGLGPAGNPASRGWGAAAAGCSTRSSWSRSTAGWPAPRPTRSESTRRCLSWSKPAAPRWPRASCGSAASRPAAAPPTRCCTTWPRC